MEFEVRDQPRTAHSQRLHSSSRMSTPSKCQVSDLIQKLPRLSISEIPTLPSPSSSAPVQPVHSSNPRMNPSSSSAVHSPQGQKGNLMENLPKTDIVEMPVSLSLSSTAQPFPIRPPSSVVHSPSVLSSASNGQTMSQYNLTSQDWDQPVRYIITAPTVHFRAPAPHLRRYL